MLGRDLVQVPGALGLVVDDDVLRGHRLAVAEVLLHVVLDVADEGLAAAAGAAQLVLEHLDERSVAAEEDGRRRGLPPARSTARSSRAGLWTALRPTSVLPEPGTPVTSTRCRVCVLAASCAMRAISSMAGCGLGAGAVDGPDLAVDEELARRLHERGEGAVGVAGEELLGGERPVRPRPLQVVDQLMQRRRPADVHAVAHADVPWRARGHDHGVDLALGAVPVVAAQVARVGGGLVEVGLVRLGLALQLEDDHGAADEQHDVRAAATPAAARTRGWRCTARRARRSRRPRRPRPGSLGCESSQARTCDSPASARNSCERDAHDARLGLREGGEVALPAVAGAREVGARRSPTVRDCRPRRSRRGY